MNLRESLSIRFTPASRKKRNEPGYWNWPELTKLVEKALKTGEEQSAVFDWHYFAVAKPAKVKKEHSDKYHDVRVNLYHLVFTFDVEKTDTTIRPAWVKKEGA